MTTDQTAAALISELAAAAGSPLPSDEREAWQADWSSLIEKTVAAGHIPDEAARRLNDLLKKAAAEQSSPEDQEGLARVREAEKCLHRIAQSEGR